MTFKEFCKELLEEYKGRYDGKVAVEIIKSLQ